MLPLILSEAAENRPLRLLFVGAHPDDIEIGCGGTAMELLDHRPGAHVTWAVLSGEGERAEEACRGAEAFLSGAGSRDLRMEGFRDGFFPWQGAEIKEWFEALKAEIAPDLIFTHHRDDRHQDHRVLSELTWNIFRDHLILEYEIPKYDGELGHPNLFVSLSAEQAERKIELLFQAFPSQAARAWFDEETFRGLMRVRGVEAGGGSSYAEAFHARKVVLG